MNDIDQAPGSPVPDAAKRDDIETVRALLADGADATRPTGTG